ncbi:hypothetical protein [Desulfocicer vacuolatum]|uniref:hypothetical protein n=1 Tax=Desulfocicer vacuolatum TaxID=2298 RepID=UPI001BB01149|nr:hypothetical protein [Desulfocicer vacuolatum]
MVLNQIKAAYEWDRSYRAAPVGHRSVKKQIIYQVKIKDEVKKQFLGNMEINFKNE